MSEQIRRKLPDWALEAIGEFAESPAEPSIQEQRGRPAWPLLVDAAMVSSFLPRDLSPGALSGPERKDAEKAVLRFAELSHDPEGSRWALTREARRAVLAECEPNEIAVAAQGTASRSSDAVSRALRAMFLGTQSPDLQSLDMQTLEAMRLAAGWLSGVTNVHVPPVEELERQIELHRLLAPFERMTGKLANASPDDPQRDRFFGRGEEMEALREYIGVIAADSVRRRVRRIVKSVSRALTGRKTMSVWGTGGVGKTTLIAKFMLEHAQAAASQFPFAYLDFDRSTVSASNPAGLLSEMCRQVGAQFRELAKPMAELREWLATLMRTRNVESYSTSDVSSVAWQFRTHIDESFSESTPFLLVFDTFEVVQYGPDQIRDLEHLIRGFYGNEMRWPRLRLIISGRRRVEEFLGETDDREIGALDLEGSAKMLEALARDAGKPIDIEEAERLVKAIAKALRDPTNDGVRPLRLRLIGELFKEGSESGPAIVQSLLDDLAKPIDKQGGARLGRVLIEGILVRRILGHVKDPRVRALADPGLVVRRITKDVIREVMTRGTAKPDLTDREPKDASFDDPAVIEPWIVDDGEAQKIFDALANEVTLVDPDGKALRHRQDVRRDMLPLIEAARPNAFKRLHQLAYDYLRKDTTDSASPGEATYHGLWLGKPLLAIDALWRRIPADPGIDPEEFVPGSEANIYLRAKRKNPLTPEEVATLPPAIRLEWLSSRSDELLSTVRVLEDVGIVHAVAGDDWSEFDERKDLAATAARMMYRAGMWRDAMTLLPRHVSPNASLSEDAEVSLLRTWTTIVAKSGGGGLETLDWLFRAAYWIKDPLVRAEIFAHAIIGMRKTNVESAAIDPRLLHRSAAEVDPVMWRREPRILRLAMATGLEVPDVLFETYLGVTERPPHDRTAVEILSRLNGEPLRLEEIDAFWASNKHGLLEEEDGRNILRALAACDHSDWFVPFGNALTRSFGEHAKLISRSARKVVAKKQASLIDLAIGVDGHSLLQIIIAEGALMAFAEILGKVTKSRAYPDTAMELAAALVEWHRVTVVL